MTILTIELRDDTYRQLRELAEARGISLDLLIENLGSRASRRMVRKAGSGPSPPRPVRREPVRYWTGWTKLSKRRPESSFS